MFHLWRIKSLLWQPGEALLDEVNGQPGQYDDCGDDYDDDDRSEDDDDDDDG